MSFAGQCLLIGLELLFATGPHLGQMLGMGLPGTRYQLLALRKLMSTSSILLSTGKRLPPLIQPIGKAPKTTKQKHNGYQCDQHPGGNSAEEPPEYVPHGHLLFEYGV
ncbi:hypothetical protein B9H00_04215 [Kushneria marisflavi]|uniref:Uncharacterized protein n=1 Tax=Kushneria marisflavi TaxID=157779 RepID=A0A240ULM5_9GAMM|nr:hypothetical protein B9H00_04215 [Kushneria marisflavi]